MTATFRSLFVFGSFPATIQQHRYIVDYYIHKRLFKNTKQNDNFFLKKVSGNMRDVDIVKPAHNFKNTMNKIK